jgi:hypothetical protein
VRPDGLKAAATPLRPAAARGAGLATGFLDIAEAIPNIHPSGSLDMGLM